MVFVYREIWNEPQRNIDDLERERLPEPDKHHIVERKTSAGVASRARQVRFLFIFSPFVLFFVKYS